VDFPGNAVSSTTLSKPVHEKYLRMIFLQIWTSMTLSKPVYEEYLRIKHFTDIDINDTLKVPLNTIDQI
jgi:hypothetical protein